MNSSEILAKLKNICSKPMFLKCAVAVGFIMIIVIMFSDISGEEKTRADGSNNIISFDSSDIYIETVEKQLVNILEEVEGVGKTEVMLTITSTEEYVFAETYKNGSSQSENDYVIIDKGSQKEALVKRINNPEISGVVIICEGGDDPRICEKIYKAVSTALNISTSRIYVAEMK